MSTTRPHGPPLLRSVLSPLAAAARQLSSLTLRGASGSSAAHRPLQPSNRVARCQRQTRRRGHYSWRSRAQSFWIVGRHCRSRAKRRVGENCWQESTCDANQESGNHGGRERSTQPSTLFISDFLFYGVSSVLSWMQPWGVLAH